MSESNSESKAPGQSSALIDRLAVKYAVPSFEDIDVQGLTPNEEQSFRGYLVRYQIYVEYRGGGLWCVADAFGQCFGRDGQDSHEPLPSSRSKEFLEKFRFSREEAFVVAARALPGFIELNLGQTRLAIQHLINQGMDPFSTLTARTIRVVDGAVAKFVKDFEQLATALAEQEAAAKIKAEQEKVRQEAALQELVELTEKMNLY